MSATVEAIKAILPHPNADRLEIAKVGGFDCIVGMGTYRPGDLAVLIDPDDVIPEAGWSKDVYGYTSRGRVKAAKLRGVWSTGLVMPLSILPEEAFPLDAGTDVSALLGVMKYEPPLPSDVAAKGGLPYGIPKTDETNWQKLPMPWGIRVDVTLKIDGSSFTAYCVLPEDSGKRDVEVGVCSRSQELKLDGEASNPWTKVAAEYDVLTKLRYFCGRRGESLALRGEVYGSGLQSSAVNPHCKKPLSVAFYSVWNVRKRQYEDPRDKLGYMNLCDVAELPTVPLLRTAVLTPELVKDFSDNRERLSCQLPVSGETVDGDYFEGVVLKSGIWSCKVINKFYDSKK